MQVFSSYRFVKAAAEQGKPIAIINIGPTRGDEHASFKADVRVGELLPRVRERIGSARSIDAQNTLKQAMDLGSAI